MVILAARTGRASRRSTAVIKTNQTNSGMVYCEREGGFMLRHVVMKLIAPRISETPARCRKKITKSTDAPACARLAAGGGGYTVQPIPAPASMPDEASSRSSDGGSSQKLMLFIRGKAMSGVLSIRGKSPLPKPPIIIGITMKKIITNVWAVTTVL